MRLIDADAMRDDWLYNGQNEYIYDTNAVLDRIDEQPTIDPESLRPRGTWINIHDGNFICSCCKNPVNIVDMMSHPLMIGYLYCPYCGTKMEGDHNP